MLVVPLLFLGSYSYSPDRLLLDLDPTFYFNLSVICDAVAVERYSNNVDRLHTTIWLFVLEECVFLCESHNFNIRFYCD